MFDVRSDIWELVRIGFCVHIFDSLNRRTLKFLRGEYRTNVRAKGRIIHDRKDVHCRIECRRESKAVLGGSVRSGAPVSRD